MMDFLLIKFAFKFIPNTEYYTSSLPSGLRKNKEIYIRSFSFFYFELLQSML